MGASKAKTEIIKIPVSQLFERHCICFHHREKHMKAAPERETPAMVKSSNLPFTRNGYEFQSLIGRGGFAEVYLVTNQQFGKQFVAKVMTVDQSELEHKKEIFDAEIQALMILNHPHIIRIYDHFLHHSQFYLILEYCKGGSLHDEIQRTKGLSMNRFVQIGTQLVSALAYCHSKNIAHRDIKPGNILMDDNHRSKLADFGLSLVTSQEQLHRSFGGSYMYTAPEIFQKKAHNPMMGDVWALGVVFAMMISGSSPWKCDSLGALKQLAAQGQFHLKKSTPPVVADLIRKMIVVEPTQRLTMEQIKAHPMFCAPIYYTPPPLYQNHNKLTQLKWDQIARHIPNASDIAFEDEFQLPDGETDPTVTYETIRAASSTIVHAGPVIKNVVSRYHPRSRRSSLGQSAQPTFNDFEATKEL